MRLLRSVSAIVLCAATLAASAQGGLWVNPGEFKPAAPEAAESTVAPPHEPKAICESASNRALASTLGGMVEGGPLKSVPSESPPQ